MTHHFTQPSRLLRWGYRYLYDPLRAGYLRRLVASLELSGSERVLDFGSGPLCQHEVRHPHSIHI